MIEKTQKLAHLTREEGKAEQAEEDPKTSSLTSESM